MKNDTKSHYALRFRNNDGIHNRGDILFHGNSVLYIGQTPECSLKLPHHPRFADTCYAVIRTDGRRGKRYIIRQESKADISVNGVELGIALMLKENDCITFDNTVAVYTTEEGEVPQTTYVKHKNQWALWCAIAAIAAVLAALVLKPDKEKEESAFDMYATEISSIYKIEADTLLVQNLQGEILEVLPLPRAEIGTGFVTNEGYFITARHCIEFWLGYEGELKPDINEITSPFVRWAIEAEADTTIHLVTKLKVIDRKGKEYRFTSDDFTIDRSHDNVYECGDFKNDYLWRSIISRYEDHDAELGDAAVMKWKHGNGRIRLAPPKAILKYPQDIPLQSFGYPQSQSKQKAVLASYNGKLHMAPVSENEFLICRPAFDKGFSGAPVFAANNNSRKAVVGIVSRLAGKHTIIVPVSQIHNLINRTIENDAHK